MPKPRKASPDYMTAAMLRAEVRKVSIALNAMNKQMRSLKTGTKLTRPGAAWTKPGPQVAGDDCKKGLWKGKLAIREIEPALRKLSERLRKTADFMRAHKLPK
ncbi:MAG: hypothetical protein JW952_08670 [Candidatus Eisenbacteria bacterium]|nr:hypothetical protein [Candidatus Eisenbacteria bacterium]